MYLGLPLLALGAIALKLVGELRPYGMVNDEGTIQWGKVGLLFVAGAALIAGWCLVVLGIQTLFPKKGKSKTTPTRR